MAATAQQQQEVQRRAAELDDVADVARVLASKSHLECLQLRPGASRADVKAKYHGLARLLHPDKCKVSLPWLRRTAGGVKVVGQVFFAR